MFCTYLFQQDLRDEESGEYFLVELLLLSSMEFYSRKGS